MERHWGVVVVDVVVVIMEMEGDLCTLYSCTLALPLIGNYSHTWGILRHYMTQASSLPLWLMISSIQYPHWSTRIIAILFWIFHIIILDNFGSAHNP